MILAIFSTSSTRWLKPRERNLMDNIISNVKETVEDAGEFVLDNAIVFGYGIGLLICIPLTIWGYRYVGRTAGREAAKTLIKEGVFVR